jgi:CheY-like chemotaxis protein
MLRRLMPENIELGLVLANGAWSTRADVSQMEQVLLNLTTNAAQAMPQGGRLAITTANVSSDELDPERHAAVPVGPYLGLRIHDTGGGMDAATLKRIFDPFFTTKEQGQGTGLGLSTVLGIVRQHGGFIRAESEPGKGTLFEILLPAETGATADAGADDPAPAGKGTETILVVEDEAVVLQLARRILERNGYNVLTAQGGAEALALLAGHKGKLDLLLTDVIMPDLTGPEVWDRVRRAWPEARVLFCSGYTADVIARHGVLEVDIPFLAKPFTVRSLARRVREVLDGPPS